MNLDDKLLGYRKDNYCSSSEDEEEPEAETAAGPAEATSGPKTGPKGVLQDYRRYQEIESLEKKQREEDRLALFKRLAMTCQSTNDEEARKVEDDEEDDFMAEYHRKRLEQMKEELHLHQAQSRPTYGKIIELDRDGFLQTIDKENPNVTIVIHIYDNNVSACVKLNRCLSDLAQHHPHVKFCKLQASQAGLSINFQHKALPTLQVYKDAMLTGNFVQMMDELDHEFYTGDVENFLLEHDVLAKSSWNHSGRINAASSHKGIYDNDSDDD